MAVESDYFMKQADRRELEDLLQLLSVSASKWEECSDNFSNKKCSPVHLRVSELLQNILESALTDQESVFPILCRAAKQNRYGVGVREGAWTFPSPSHI